MARFYDWGSRTAIPAMLGLAASDRTWAELWFGAHPSGPAMVGSGSGAVRLDQLITADPETALGPAVAARFGSLPFLLKVLAAALPLSLQAHPSAEAARAGFAREEALGIPIHSPQRSFRDRSPKPELICALTRFDMLCGFRDPNSTLALLDTIETPALDPLRRRLSDHPTGAGLRDLTTRLLTDDTAATAGLSHAVAQACAGATGDWSAERAMVADLETHHRGDPGVVVALLLNLVTLQPGQALFLGAGSLHAYLRGTGVEVMASSDNVIRAGLTSKPVDISTFLDVVSTDPSVPDVQQPAPVGTVTSYRTSAPEFSLQRIEVSGEATVTGGPAIVLCTRGQVRAGDLGLDCGRAAWVGADTEAVVLSGEATVFRAGVGSDL